MITILYQNFNQIIVPASILVLELSKNNFYPFFWKILLYYDSLGTKYDTKDYFLGSSITFMIKRLVLLIFSEDITSI